MAYGKLAFAVVGGVARHDIRKSNMEKQAELDWQATQEQVRRMEEEHDQIIGQARADVGASGFTSNSQSQSAAIGQAEQEMARSRSQILTTGWEQYKSGGRAAQSAGVADTMTGIGQGLRIGAEVESWFS